MINSHKLILNIIISFIFLLNLSCISTGISTNASVDLYGEKTDVELGENVLLRLSAVNYITNPIMHVQVIIIPPSGMSVVSTEFVKTMAGQYTTNYQLQPGDGKDIEVKIIPNQVGDFNITGKIIYYFGNDKSTGEYHNLNLPIKVRSKGSENKDPGNVSNNEQKSKIENSKIDIKKMLDCISDIFKIISDITNTISEINRNIDSDD